MTTLVPIRGRIRPHDEGGFTLVELLVVVVLLGVVGTMVSGSVINALQAGRRGQERVYALTELERGSQRLTRELRTAEDIRDRDPATGALQPPTASEITVTVYRDGGRQVHTFLAPTGTGDLSHRVVHYPTATASTPTSDVTTTLVPDLDQTGESTFAYLKKDGSPWAVSDGVDEIARVQIVLVRDLPEQDAIRVETAVYLRNSD